MFKLSPPNKGKKDNLYLILSREELSQLNAEIAHEYVFSHATGMKPI